MPSNLISSYLGIFSFGESHGKAIGLILDDIKPNLDFPMEEIYAALSKRRPSTSHHSTRSEADRFEVISGLLNGKTTGMPICILIYNDDIQPDDYLHIKDIFRPGHADYAWFQKYKIYDYRGGGRSSGRETVARVIAAELFRSYLPELSFTYNCTQIGKLSSAFPDEYSLPSPDNPMCWNDASTFPQLQDYLDSIKNNHDSVGAILKIKIDHVPVGLGDPLYEKLNANIAKTLMSIGSVKGVLFGDGMELGTKLGSDVNDAIGKDGLLSNHLGGINGGVSNGNSILITLVIRPIASIAKAQHTVDKDNHEHMLILKGRHDVCHVSRIIPVIEAMLIITLSEAMKRQNLLQDKAIGMSDFRETIDKIDEDILLALYRRKQIVNQVKDFKTKNQLCALDLIREQEIDQNCRSFAHNLGLDEDLVSELVSLAIRICR